MLSKPFQKVSLLTPVPGSTLVLMNSYSSVATCRPWTGVRCVMEDSVGSKKEKGNQSKNERTSRRWLAVRVGGVPSSSKGRFWRFTQSVR